MVVHVHVHAHDHSNEVEIIKEKFQNPKGTNAIKRKSRRIFHRALKTAKTQNFWKLFEFLHCFSVLITFIHAEL
jgi:hypothetical protein